MKRPVDGAISVCRRTIGRRGRPCTLLLDRGLQRDGGINYGWHGRSEVLLTLFQQPGMSDAQYAADAALVQADLARLKHALEPQHA